MHVRPGKAALAVATLAFAVMTAGCEMPGPSGNEINLSDEGMKNGAAAARGLTPVALEDVELGRAINNDRTVADAADHFQPKDTVYASIRVSGSANSGLVRAVWSTGKGEVLQDDTRIVAPSRGEVVSVQMARPQGLAGGRYRLDVFLDDRLMESREFSVEGGQESAPGMPHGTRSPDPTES